MKKLFLVLCLLFLVGCGKEEKTLVCIGKAKECTYVAVMGSTIGEEELVCDKEYGDIEATFIYSNDDKWDSSVFVTKYYENLSSNFDMSSIGDCQRCVVKEENNKIILEENFIPGEYQNGSIDEMKKYMSSLGYSCK